MNTTTGVAVATLLPKLPEHSATEPATGTPVPYQGYRMLTVVVPLNSHNCPLNRQRNMKMHYVMRLRFCQLSGVRNYLRLSPQSESTLRHGALCFRFKRQFKPENLHKQEWLTRLIKNLQAEELCPYLFVYDDAGMGEATHLDTIRVSSNEALPKAPNLKVSTLQNGFNMHPTHVPHFAFQMLITPANQPVKDIRVSPESYRSYFGTT